jgi:hypothetical protein
MSNYRQGTRRRMNKFRLGEVSFVDRPAQTHATADISKASVDELLDGDLGANEEMVKRGDLVSMATSSEDGHQHGISLHGDCDGLRIIVHYAAMPGSAEGGAVDRGHDHQVIRSADGQYTLTENLGHTHSIDSAQMANVLLEAMNKAEDNPDWDHIPMELGGVPLADLPEVQKASSNEDHDEGEPTMAEPTTEQRLAAAEAENATLKAVNEMTPEHRAHYDGIDKALDDDAATAFLKADAKTRDAIVSKAKADADAETAKSQGDDPVVFTSDDGTEYRKSDDPRLVKMAQDRDADRKESIRLQKAAEDADLTKRAEGDLASFPGDLAVRKAILKAVDGIKDDTVRVAAHDALKAQNAKMAPAFQTIGASGAPVQKSDDAAGAEAQLDELAKKYQADNPGTDFYTAYEKVSEANPELLNKAVAG